MVFGIVMLLMLSVSICFCYWFIRQITRLGYSAGHAQWLWDSGLQESARIVNPYLISWIGF